MSNINSGVLCPDCGIEIISIEKYTSGQLCNSCSHRKAWALKKNETYVKYKDLTQKQQEKIIQQRTYNEHHRETKKQMMISNDNNENITDLDAIEYKVTTNSSNHKGGKRLYPDEVYDYIIQNASPLVSTQELYEQIIERWPEIAETFTKIKLGKYLYARSLPFRRLTDDEKNVIMAQARTKRSEKIEPIKEELNVKNNLETVNIELNGMSNTKQFEDVVNTSETEIEEDKLYDEEARFKPVIDEVNEVLNKKFDEVGCNLECNYSIQDYIDAFRILRFLVKNYKDVTQKRNDQWDIANKYQEDIVHTMENEISKPGDTYLQDKMHVLRDIRRGYELDKISVDHMKQFLSSMERRTNEFTTIIEFLEKQKSRKDTPKYVPNVDDSMIGKYDWVQSTNPSTTKLMQKPLLVTNSKQNKKAGNPVFIATCYLSGGGYGTFKKWTKEVSFPTQDEAQRAIDLELDTIKKKNKNIMISDFHLYRKNV